MEDLLFLEPRTTFDPMIMGVCTATLRLIYDQDALIQHWFEVFRPDAEDEDHAWTMAVEWFEYNVQGAYMGEHTPMYASKISLEEILMEYPTPNSDVVRKALDVAEDAT
jgi:hypothetical protein